MSNYHYTPSPCPWLSNRLAIYLIKSAFLQRRELKKDSVTSRSGKIVEMACLERGARTE